MLGKMVHSAFFSKLESTAITNAGKFKLAVDVAVKHATTQMQALTRMASAQGQNAKTVLLGSERSCFAQ